MKHDISYFYNALLEYHPLHQVCCETKFIKYTEKTNWQSQGTFKMSTTNTSMQECSGIGQLRHQSATAPSLATHAADAVAAHQCHERDSDVIFTFHAK